MSFQIAHPITVSDVIERMGGPSKAAEKLGIKNPSVVLNWRARNSIPPDRVIAVEAATGISRYALRPDIFGADPAAKSTVEAVR